MPKRKLLIASKNKGKVEEIKYKLKDLPFELLALDEISGEPVKEVEENAMSFEGNAIIKAMIFGNRFGCLTLGDDSGLAIDALGGRPGIHTSRYQGSSSEHKYLNILDEMENVPDGKRNARFIGAIAIYDPAAEIIHTCQDELTGLIAQEPKGDFGFGYDPIMYLPELGKTVAELTIDEKSAIDHRGKALEKAKKILLEKFLQ
ncbi:MAG: RdgB/HAM1 family non-canonical purine NTP pyrophosphatase [Patescibacteria group bacterium]|jgi:XTP/dITP diphosphohydrolase